MGFNDCWEWKYRFTKNMATHLAQRTLRNGDWEMYHDVHIKQIIVTRDEAVLAMTKFIARNKETSDAALQIQRYNLQYKQDARYYAELKYTHDQCEKVLEKTFHILSKSFQIVLKPFWCLTQLLQQKHYNEQLQAEQEEKIRQQKIEMQQLKIIILQKTVSCD
jgi:hypothetical protein